MLAGRHRDTNQRRPARSYEKNRPEHRLAFTRGRFALRESCPLSAAAQNERAGPSLSQIDCLGEEQAALHGFTELPTSREAYQQ